jgi:uncharacterized protein
LARNKEDFVVIEGAGHYALYDTPEYIAQAMERLAPSYGKHIGIG